MTSTPSATAASTAEMLSLVAQPSGTVLPAQQTLYIAILAAGAMPEASPKSEPLTMTCETGLPAAVDDVCAPWLSPSRGDRYSSSARWPEARKPAEKKRALTILLLQVLAGNSSPGWHTP